jgi:hypothetical protein
MKYLDLHNRGVMIDLLRCQPRRSVVEVMWHSKYDDVGISDVLRMGYKYPLEPI